MADFYFAGLTEFTRGIERLVVRTDIATRNAVVKGAAAIEREAKLKAGEAGRHQRGTPTPAAPGTGPAIITGTLRRSIHTRGPYRRGIGTWEAMIGPSVIYGRRVELEYDYPYMRPAVDLVHKTVLPVLLREWGAAIAK